MAEFGVVRELNEGVSRIYDEMKKYFLDEPEFKIDEADNLILILRNNYLGRNENRENSIKKNENIKRDWENLNSMERLEIQFIADKKECKTIEIAKHINRSPATTRRWLNKLIGMKLIESFGTNEHDPKRAYRIVE